jgi:hypothetical protein
MTQRPKHGTVPVEEQGNSVIKSDRAFVGTETTYSRPERRGRHAQPCIREPNRSYSEGERVHAMLRELWVCHPNCPEGLTEPAIPFVIFGLVVVHAFPLGGVRDQLDS